MPAGQITAGARGVFLLGADLSDVRFLRCVRLVLDVEAGWADHPADHGGPTMRGITERIFLEASTRGIIPSSTRHRDLTADQARAIYRKLYWEPARCDEFPPPLDLLLFDGYVNHRPGPAVELMQRALRVDDDGRIGPATISAALANPRPSLVVARYIVVREDFYEQIVRNEPSQAAFIRGWKNRLVTIHREAMKDLAACRMKIPKGNFDSPGPCWIPIQDGEGKPHKPVIRCRCGVNFHIGLHHVHADGRVTASFYHPETPGAAGCADNAPGCGFHEFLELEGYEGPEFPPDPPKESA